MTSPVMPDFTDLYPPPKVDSTTAAKGKSAVMPDFSDLYPQQAALSSTDDPINDIFKAVHLTGPGYFKAVARGAGEFFGGIVNLGVNLNAAARLPYERDILAKIDPNAAAEMDKRHDATLKAFGEVATSTGHAATHPSEWPGAAMGLIRGIATIPEDALKVLYGALPTGEGDASFSAGKVGDYTPYVPTKPKLTDDQIQEAAKQTTGNIVAAYIGGSGNKVLMDEMSGLKPVLGRKGISEIGKALSPQEIEGIVTRRTANITNQQMSDLATKRGGFLTGMPWAQRTIAGLASGATAGALYGAGTAPPDQNVQAAITMAMIAMPLGLVHSTIGESYRIWKGNPVDHYEIARGMASRLNFARMSNGIEGKTPFTILFDADNLQRTKTIQAAAARKIIAYDDIGVDANGVVVRQGRNAGIVPMVEGEMIPEVLKETEPQPGKPEVISVVHARADGFHDIYIGPIDTPERTKDFFAKTGFVEGQPVTYGGNERMMIRSAEKSKNGRYTVTLRDMITEQHTEGVSLNDIVRPTNKYIGELSLYQNRTLKLDDIFDPALGIADRANPIEAKYTKVPLKLFQDMHVNTTLESFTGHNLNFNAEGKPISVIDETGQTEIPLHPGINEVTRANPNIPSQIDGTTMYVAGNGQVTGVFAWSETERPSGGRIKRVSESWHWKDPAAPKNPIESETTKAIAKYREDNHFDTSNSTLSEGAQKARIRGINNGSWVARQYNELAIFTPEAFLQDLTTGFLDHIALLDGDIHLSPEEVVDRIGLKRVEEYPHRQGQTAFAGIGETTNTIQRAREGMGTSDSRTTGIAFQTRQAQEAAPGVQDTGISPHAAADAIAAETEAGHVPEVASRAERKLNDPLTITSSLSFDDMVESYLSSLGDVRPEMKAAIKYHLEFEMGKILTGDHNTLRQYTDKRTAYTWRSFIDNTQQARAAWDKAATIGDNVMKEKELGKVRKLLGLNSQTLIGELNYHLMAAEKTKAVFEARIRQLENPVPLELSAGERTRLTEIHTKAAVERKAAVNDLLSVALSNGMYAERGFGGAIHIRDLETHKKLPVSFANEELATQWIRDTGGIVSRDIDGGTGNMVPPEAVGGGKLPPQRQGPAAHEIPYDFKPDNWFGRLGSYIDTQFPRLTAKRAFFTALDDKLRTKFFEDVYQPLQTAKMASQAKKEPHRAALKGVEDILNGSGVPRDKWGRVNDYRNTMSPADIDKHVFGDRVPTQSEIDMSEQLASLNIDIKNVYKYNRDIAQLDKDARVRAARLDPKAPDTQAKIQEIKQNLAIAKESVKTDLNMDSNHLQAAQMFSFAEQQGREKFRLDVTTRRAHSIMNKELSRSDFAESQKMTKAEIQAAERIDAIEANLIAEADLSPSLRDYIQHHLHEEQAIDPAQLPGKEKVTAQLAQKLVGTGEIGLSDRDPVLSTANLINKLVDHRYFDNTWRESYAAMKKHLLSMPVGAREYASRVTGEYVFGMRGVPNAHDTYAKEMVKAYFDDIELTKPGQEPSKAHQQIINDFSDVLLASSSAALLGGRLAQGVRDLHGFMRNYYARVGPTRLANGFRLAFERDPKTGRLPIYQLAEQGKVPGLSILQFLSEQEVADALVGQSGNHTVRDAVFKAAKIGLVTSGQHNVYALAHAISYLETSDFAHKALLDLSREKITKKAAYARLKLDTYDVPVAQGFDNLVTQGKYNDAVEYLAQATGTETAFVYGLQNHPYGWGSKQGRLMGQFGQWPVWDRDFLVRLASRGTAAQRAAAMSRYALSEAALWAAGRATGINVKSWYGVPGILFAGSPLMGLVGQVSDMMGLRGKQRQREATTVYGGKVPIISQFVPGASAFADYYQAYQLSQKRYGPVPILAKGLGFAVDRSQRSWLDEWQGQYPRQAP